jgi:hypothetical protein
MPSLFGLSIHRNKQGSKTSAVTEESERGSESSGHSRKSKHRRQPAPPGALPAGISSSTIESDRRTSSDSSRPRTSLDSAGGSAKVLLKRLSRLGGKKNSGLQPSRKKHTAPQPQRTSASAQAWAQAWAQYYQDVNKYNNDIYQKNCAQWRQTQPHTAHAPRYPQQFHSAYQQQRPAQTQYAQPAQVHPTHAAQHTPAQRLSVAQNKYSSLYHKHHESGQRANKIEAKLNRLVQERKMFPSEAEALLKNIRPAFKPIADALIYAHKGLSVDLQNAEYQLNHAEANIKKLKHHIRAAEHAANNCGHIDQPTIAKTKAENKDISKDSERIITDLLESEDKKYISSPVRADIINDLGSNREYADYQLRQADDFFKKNDLAQAKVCVVKATECHTRMVNIINGTIFSRKSNKATTILKSNEALYNATILELQKMLDSGAMREGEGDDIKEEIEAPFKSAQKATDDAQAEFNKYQLYNAATRAGEALHWAKAAELAIERATIRMTRLSEAASSEKPPQD